MNINDAIEDSGDFVSEHLVYKSGVKVKYPNKAAEIYFGILPAIPEGAIEAEEDSLTCGTDKYLPCRVSGENSKSDQFTNWATAAYYYAFINHEKSMLSPKTLDENAFCPIEEIIRHAKRNPSWCKIVGFGKDGKKLQDSYSDPDVRIPSRQMIFCMNAVILFDPKSKQDEVVVLQTPSTAFRGQGENSKAGGWGLVSSLKMKDRRNVDDYYWGDVTDPNAAVPMVLEQMKPPTGSSRKIYNIVVAEDEDPIKIPKSVLEARYDLRNIFYEIEAGEIVDYVTHVLSDVPDLLRMSFASRIPNYENILKNAVAIRVDMGAHTTEEEEEEQTEFRPRRTKKIEIETEEEPVMAPRRRRQEAQHNDDDDIIDVTPVKKEEVADEVQPKRSFAPKPVADEEAASGEAETSRPLTRRKRPSSADLIGED